MTRLEEVKAAYDDWGAAHADALDADAAADAAKYAANAYAAYCDEVEKSKTLYNLNQRKTNDRTSNHLHYSIRGMARRYAVDHIQPRRINDQPFGAASMSTVGLIHSYRL